MPQTAARDNPQAIPARVDGPAKTRERDIDYHFRREAQERAAAAASIDPGARRVHAELADRHAALAGGPQASRVLNREARA